MKHYVLLRKPPEMGNRWDQFTVLRATDKREALRQVGAKHDDGYDYRVVPLSEWRPVRL